MTNKTPVQQEGYKQIRALLEQMRTLVENERSAIMRREPRVTDRSKILFGGVEKLLNMTRVIILLSGQRAADEMNVLLRTMVDLAVNICYLQLAKETEVSRYLKHDLIAGRLAIHRLHAATHGESTLPLEIVERIRKGADKASSQGHLSPMQVDWSKETHNLRERAEFIDQRLGGHTVAGMYAAIYTMGSGYTHASFKTIKPYIHWLVDGHFPHELEQLYDDSSVLHGVIFVLSIIQFYFEWKHGLSEKPRTDILASTEHIVTILTLDYRQHMERKIQEQKARILAKNRSELPIHDGGWPDHRWRVTK